MGAEVERGLDKVVGETEGKWFGDILVGCDVGKYVSVVIICEVGEVDGGEVVG